MIGFLQVLKNVGEIETFNKPYSFHLQIFQDAIISPHRGRHIQCLLLNIYHSNKRDQLLTADLIEEIASVQVDTPSFMVILFWFLFWFVFYNESHKII